MTETHSSAPELPNIITIIAHRSAGTPLADWLIRWENVIFSAGIIILIAVVAWIASKKRSLVPRGIANAIELYVSAVDSFVIGIIGPDGRRYTPFIGTLFIYIITMNLIGLVPLIKSPTASWSTTLALALCVFVYVQYTGIRQLGIVGYFDHLLGKPRGFLAFSVFMPLMMFFLHIVSELIRPISLSLRLRSNIWGDDVLLAVVANFGIKGLPLLLFSSVLIIIAACVQALVFCLLTTIYFALFLRHEDEGEAPANHS